MITYKYKIQNKIDISNQLIQYNNVIRFAYNRFKEEKDISQAHVEQKVKKIMNNIDSLDASIIKCAVSKARSLEINKKIIFGGKILFNKLKYKKNSDKTIWNEKRNLTPLLLRGSASDNKGNRKATLDIIDNNQIILKWNKSNHTEIQLPRLNKNHLRQLSTLELLCSENKACFSIEVSSEFVYIIFDEKILNENNYEPKPNRYMSFDLNPNYIGLIVADDNQVIYKEVIEMKGINKKDIPNNKRKHEILEISKYVSELAKHFHVENVCFEKLNMKPQQHKKGKFYNRLVNNYWLRNLFSNNIKKRCNIIGMKIIEVLPQYSSFIGQINNPSDIDSIASAIELNRRAVLFDQIYIKKVLPKQDIIYPKFNIGSLATHWKEMLGNNLNNIKSWKDMYNVFKKSKTSYRFLFDLDKIQVDSFRFSSYKSFVNIHTFV